MKQGTPVASQFTSMETVILVEIWFHDIWKKTKFSWESDRPRAECRSIEDKTAPSHLHIKYPLRSEKGPWMNPWYLLGINLNTIQPFHQFLWWNTGQSENLKFVSLSSATHCFDKAEMTVWSYDWDSPFGICFRMFQLDLPNSTKTCTFNSAKSFFNLTWCPRVYSTITKWWVESNHSNAVLV